MAIDNSALGNKTLFATTPHMIVQYYNEMDAMNAGEWLISAGAMDESFCIASKVSFASAEVAYDKAQPAID